MTDSKPLLLLVDDVPANLHVLVAALRNDYRIKTATNGRAALELARRAEKPDLILLDVMMPDMNGIEVLRQLREEKGVGDIPVIFVSADSSEQSQLEGLELGADDYLTKPVVPTVLLARVRNILQRKQAEAQLRLAAHVFEHSGEAIVITDRDNRIVSVNPAFTRITGYSIDDVRGRDPKILASGRTTKEEYRVMWEALLETGFWHGEMWDRHKDGGVYPKLITISVVRNARGEIDFYIASFTNISEQKAAEARIHHIAHHDALTGLPNRLHLQASLEQSLAIARRDGIQLALMFIDLDRFKLINDTLGHNVGDGLLVEVARRLREICRDSDLVARLGGDEFVVAVNGADAARAARHVADKIQARLAQPCHVGGHEITTTPSIGIAVFPQDADSIDTLMKCADVAMYQAKSVGRNNFQFFSAERNRATTDRMALESRLQLAIARNELVLHFQPQLATGSGRLAAVEALVRWNHPQLGLLFPEEFLGLAEETGFIVAIGDWSVAAIAALVAQWSREGRQPVPVAMNLSLRQLQHPTLVADMAATLRGHGIEARWLEVEVSEGVAMQDPEFAVQVLHQLRSIGVGVCLDEFGSGYSSLARLRSFPVDRVKLDRSLIKGLERDSDTASVCSAAIAVAKALGWGVVAQGVESVGQREHLRQLGCDVMQGYLFSRPVPVEELDALFSPAKREAG